MADLLVQKTIMHLGREYQPGDTIPKLDDQLADELVERGYLGTGEPVPEVTEAEAPTEEVEETEDLSKLNVAALKTKADEAGLTYEPKAKKADLIALLSGETEAPTED